MTDTDRREFLQQTAGAMGAFALPASMLEPILPPRSAPLTVALVGAGRHGRAILAELQKLEQVKVAAVCDSVAGRLRSGLRRVRGAQGYDSHGKLLEAEKDVEAVIIATPTHIHREIAEDSLQAGKHVYCEAPLASTVEDAQAIVRAARGNGKVFQSGMLARSNPIYKLARSFFRSGTLRNMLNLRAQSHQKTSWRMAASNPADEKALNWRLDPELTLGLPGEMGTHQFDVFHWFLGDYPLSVRGSGAVQAYDDGRTIADTVQCDLTFANDLHLSWQGTLGNSFGGRFETLAGTMAAIKLKWNAGWLFKEADAPTQGWEVYANRETYYDDEGITLIADATKLAKQGKLKEGVGLPHPPLYYGLVDFVTSVTESKPSVCSAEEGLRAAVVGMLSQRAVVTGTEQEIDRKLFEIG